MLYYGLLILFIYLTLVSLYYCQNLKGVPYAEVCSKSTKVHESDIYRGKENDDKLSDQTYTHIFNLFMKNNKHNENKNAVTELEFGKPKRSYTYGSFFNRVLSFSNSLDTLDGGVPTKKYDETHNNGLFRILGIYGANSANWITADLSAMVSGVTTLVMHSKFSINEVIEILNESKLEWLCIDLNLVDSLLEHKDELPHLKKLIILDTVTNPVTQEKRDKRNDIMANTGKDKGGEHIRGSVKGNNTATGNGKGGGSGGSGNTNSDRGVEMSKEEIAKLEKEKYDQFQKVKKRGKALGLKVELFEELTRTHVSNYKVKKESQDFISTIVYTSGTSGKPKGVMLSNKNIFYTVVPFSGISIFLEYNPDTHFSYLPLSHIYERAVCYLSLYRGMEIKVWSKDINLFGKDLNVSGANVVIGVPKIFNRIYTNIVTEISKLPPIKRFFVEKILALRKLDNNGNFSKVLESLTHVSKQIKNKINPKLDLFFSGGGKISPTVESELSTLLDINFYQGYGLTETTGPIFVQNKKDKSVNNIGGPVSPDTQYKVVTWEAYDAKSNPPKGELLIKSNQLFSGYFLRKEQTKEAFTEDNFYKTGDVVQINSNGSITFLDRSKGLVKLSQGEYIETEMLNNLYSDIPFVNYCVVYGDDSLDGPLAIMSLDKELLGKSLEEDNILNQLGMTKKQFLETIDDDKLNTDVYLNYVKQKMTEIYKRTNLNRYNLIQDIYLTVKTWDTSNYLTPTFKVRRFYVFKDYDFFIQKIKEFYKSKLKAGRGTAGSDSGRGTAGSNSGRGTAGSNSDSDSGEEFFLYRESTGGKQV
ncbi:ATP-dependent acyl-CoA synthetase, putative [Plasmodium ovale wallikeri]|uniref:ATP-dependent acyl-CoA synthetase, putative n=1 Tax=Plasmodium ovale wallikeri TaxID=864142 RepID=A0A1A8YKT0_PLAOA|nr:ATP-dependent acyl-CoA synthetase, putative [Plasmodium ovale wallikeri]